ncbi:MAG: TMEM175 family protein [Bacteroidetes bacterium]|nr:TMEM175 family protein [Bacteroidota bacterium]MCL5033608.1 TMEM175 family protein [Bacteroidota bacterium]
MNKGRMEAFSDGVLAIIITIMLLAAIAYFILAKTLVSLHGKESVIAAALGRDFKGKISVAIYVAGILIAFLNRWTALALYVLVAIVWLVPDRRIERTFAGRYLYKSAASGKEI